MIGRRAASLFLVLIAARIASGTLLTVHLSPWTPAALLWQDALAALVFLGIDSLVRRETPGWTLYGIAVVYVAINVGIDRVLYSPLTWPMIRAAGGPLSDSVRHHATFANLSAVLATLAAGVVAPLMVARVAQRGGRFAAGAAIAIAVMGPYATSKIDMAGRYRNAFGALWPIRAPAPAGAAAEADWRRSPFSRPLPNDLAKYRGFAQGRNVVLIILESAGAQYWQPAEAIDGRQLDPLPQLTSLASTGIVFENAYTVYPESIKGLFSVLCSRYPAFGIDAEAYAKAITPSLPAQLRAAGYRTGLFHSGRFMYLGMQGIVENRGFDTLEDAGAIGGDIHSSFGVDEPAAVKRILGWIDSLPQDQRFLATYLPIAGHHPYATPEPGPFKEDYLNALHYGDASVGTLIQGLRSRGLVERTLFVVFGDHGEAFGQHDGNFGHTQFVYQENVHVPLVLSAPGLFSQPGQTSATASLIDVAPTTLDLLGLNIPGEFQGRSLLSSTPPQIAPFFTDYSLGWLGLADGCWKYIYETGSDRSKLFEICRDPAESRDLAVFHADRVQVYKHTLLNWSAANSVR